MKYSRSAITQLTRWYKQILIKCAILNAVVMTLSFGAPASASDITGITPNGNIYNIEAAKVSGSTGFREYNNFNLDEGDIANLIYKSGYDKFVNLVDNKVNINGIVNTMRDNNFFNGHAIFVSPNGIVIGASGVLNVGSLTLATPSQAKFDAMKNAYNGSGLGDYEVGKDKYKGILTDAQGDIIVNGKIMARGDVELYGKNITVEGTAQNNAGIVAGVQNQNSAFINKEQAEQVFNSLVNSNIKQANTFNLVNGKLKLVADASSKSGDNAGNIKAEIDIKNANLGADQIDIKAKAKVDRQERIDLAQAIVNVENSSLTGNSVSVVAEATQNKSVDLTNIEDGVQLIQNTFEDLLYRNTPSITSLWGTAGKAEAEVNIKNSSVDAVKATGDKDANSIIINAIASSSTSENANLLTPTILDFITNSDEAKISEYFSNDIYGGFEGAKSSAIVTVDHSVLSSKGTMGIDISSNASSELKTDQSLISFIMPVGLYGVGTETISKAIVKNSLLSSNIGRINVDAISTNINDIIVSNNSFLQINIEPYWLGILLNNNVKTQTEALVENSVVNATYGGLQVFATNLANSNVNLDMSATTGMTQEGGDGTGNSGAAVVGVLDRSDNDVSAIIKNSAVNTYGNVLVMADSLNITGNSASASTYDWAMQRPPTWEGDIKDKMKSLNFKLTSNIFDKIRGISTVPGTKESLIQGGGAFVWNVTNNNTTAKIENSTVNTVGKANNVTVQATTLDLMKNNTYAESAGEEKIGLGLAVIYNDETNKTTANIDSSTINAKSVLVDAQTELPMNMGQLTFGLKLPFKIKGVDTIQFGGNFASEANGKWDISLADPINVNYDDPDFDLSGTLKQNVLTTYENLKPKAKMSGFFNNLSKTQTKASTAGIAGSVVYNEVKNNTTADITNESKIMLANGGSLIVNAINSVIGYNAAGMIDFLIKQINYKIPGQPDWKYQPEVEAGTFGLGFNFLWNDYTNDATAKIEDSSIVAPGGSIDVRSATEQAYITITMTGGKAKTVGIDGSIHRQILEGTTLASISNTSKDEKAKNIISAKTVNVNAGKAKVRTAGGAMARITPEMIKEDKEKNADDETKIGLTDRDVWYLSRNTQRDAEETITNIIAQGAWTTQSSGGENSSSVGIAVGASVNVTDIDRSVKAEINNYVISADDVAVDSDSLTQSLNIEIAAAFSGGVDKDKDPTNATGKTKKTTEEDEEKINKKLDENADENADDNPLPKPNNEVDEDELPNPKNPGGLSNYEYEGLKAMGYSEDQIEEMFDNNYNSQFYQNKPQGMTNAKYRELVQAGYSDETINYYQGMVDGGATDDEIQQYLNTIGGNVGGRNPGGVSDYIYYNLRQMGFTDEEIENAFSNNGGNPYPNKPAEMSNEKYLQLRQQNYTDEEIQMYQGMLSAGATEDEIRSYFYNTTHSPYVNKPLGMTNEKYLELLQKNFDDEEINRYQKMVNDGVSDDMIETYFRIKIYTDKPDGMSNETYRELRKYYTTEEISLYQGMIDGGATDADARNQLNSARMYPNKPEGMTVEKYQSLRGEGFSDAEIKVFKELLDAGFTENQIRHEMKGENRNNGNPRIDNLSKDPNPNNPGGISDWLYQFYKDGGFTDDEIRMMVADDNSQQGENNNLNAANSLNNFSAANYLAASQDNDNSVGNNANNRLALKSNGKPILLKSDNPNEEEINNNFKSIDNYLKGDPSGGAVSNPSSTFSLSAAGAVNVTNDDTKVESSINYSNINAKNSLTVDADRENKMLNVSGGVAGSKKVGAGAAVNVYEQGGSVKSYVDNSNVKFDGETTKLDVTADNINRFINIAIGVGAATNDEQNSAGFKAAAGGSASANVLKPEIDTYINGSSIASSGGKIDAKLVAKNDLDIYNIAGGGSYSSGSSAGVSAGAAINYNNINNTIHSYVKDSTLKDINNLDIKAQADNDLMEFAVAGAILTGTSGSGLGIEFAGSANIDYIHDIISAQTINSTVTADKDITINAESDSENLQVAGSFDYSSAKTGVGVNGSIDINQYENNIFAQIDADSKILKANDIAVSARSEEKANVVPVGLSISTDKNIAMLAATVGVNIIDNSVRSYVSGDIGTDENKVRNLNVNAYDETTLYTRGGTLALAAADTVANVGGSFNRDLISKTVEAKIGREDYKYKDADGNEHTVHYDKKNKIKATGDVSASAASVNSLGGTKNSAGVYERDEITAEGYNDTLMRKDENNNYSGLNYDNSFENWNMFYNFAIGAKASVSGAVIVKTIEDAVKAEVTFADITSNNLKLMATDRSISNIVAGQISASSKGAIGAHVIVTHDGSETSSLISNNSDITLSNKLEMTSWNRKDSNRIVVAADVGKFAGAVNVLHNTVEDTNTAKIANSTVNAKEISVKADEDINASDIVVSVAGSQNVAIAVAPVINYYGDTSDETDEAKKKGKTLTEISDSTINDAAISMQANTDIDARDIVVGAGFAMKGLSGTGVAVKNNNDTITKAIIGSNSVVNTAKDIVLNADSTIDFNNWLVGVAAGAQGAALAGNVIINEITSAVETGILDSKIKKAGNIVLNTNKGKKDKIDNHSIGVSATFSGVSASGLVSYNVYNNENIAKIDNTAIDSSDAIDVQAFSDKEFYDLAVGVAATIKGGAAGVSAVVHNVDSTVQAYVDAKSQKINTLGDLLVKASDNTLLDTTGVNVAAGLVAIGGNINLYYSDNIVTAEIASATDGQINAKNADVKATSTHSTDTSKVGVVVGAGALATDITVMRIGKVPTYTEDDEASKVNTAVDTTKTIYNLLESEGHYNPSPAENEKETGTIARIKGNLKTTDDINIKSQTTLKGKGNNDTVDLGYVNVNVTGITAAGNVKNIKFSNKTIAGIVDGNIESENGGITVDAESHAKTKIHGTAVDVTGAVVTYASDIINNSSETIAQIGGDNKNTTINAKDDITVKSYSESKAEIDTTHVMVSTGDFAGVDIVDLQDSNHAYAQITGNTSINNNASKKDADGNLKTDEFGKLTLHATSDTELKSESHTTKVQMTQVYTGNKSNVAVNTDTRAIIKDTTGVINTDGLDIITDYKTMRAYQETGVVRVVGASAAAQAMAGAKMNADFSSGIDSLTGLIIDNTGKTNIETAKALISGENGKITAESEASAVEVSGFGAYAGTFANAENSAKSHTYLKVKEHSADSLDINSYLYSKAHADVDSTKVSLTIGVNSLGFDAKDTSDLDLTISGANTIVGDAIINAIHSSDIKSSLYGFNFSLVGSGQRIRIDADLNSSTKGSIGGDFNANQATFDFQTTRNSVTDISTGSGGIINVNDGGSTETSNRLRGNTALTIDGLKTDKDIANNNITINNTSTNIFDTMSKHGSGGVVNVSTNASHTELDTSTTTNIKNADINSNNSIEYNVTNNTLVADSGANNGGGVVSVLTDEFNRSYTSGAYLNLENSKIRAKDINLNTLSNIASKDNKTFYYNAGGGGLASISDVNVNNTLTQTSQIDLKNSTELYAENDAKLEVKTGSWFKQFSDNDNRGFVGAPSADIELNETNSNKINLDSSSLIKADNQTIFNFDSNNTLSSEAVSEAYGFAAPAEAYSYLRFTANNELNNSGSIIAGKLVDINYMNNSFNDLYNRVRTESTALVADTEEGGYLNKTVNNRLKIQSGAEIVSNKDIEVSYSEGKGPVYSRISWETNSAWGLISDDDYWYSDHTYVNPSLDLNGKMVAGEGNSKYIVIKKDGSIDEEKTQGFSADTYILEGGNLADGATIKAQRLNSINGKIESAEEVLIDITTQKEVLDNEKAIYEREKTSAENTKADFKELVDGGYSLLNIEVAEGKTISAFEEQIQNDIQLQIVGEGSDKITAEKYASFKEKSDAKIKEIVEANKADPENAVDVYTALSDYWANDDSLDLTATQKTTIKTAFDAVQSKLGISTNKKFMTYRASDGKKYAGVTNPTTVNNVKTCSELSGLDATLENAAEKIDALDIKIAHYSNAITDLNNELTDLRNQKTNIENTDASEFAIAKDEEYSILFSDISSNTARIKLDGMTNNNINGAGIFNIAAAGLKVDNYSTRSLIFNNIDLGSAHQSGLIIGDKNFGEFVDSEKAVNGSNAYAYKYGKIDMFGRVIYDTKFDEVGTSGAHYVSSEDGTGFSGVIINNYYDTANPFAISQSIPHPTYTADITFNGMINTGGHQLGVFNDSGSITAKNFNPNGMSTVDIVSTKGDINLTSPSTWRRNGKLNIFAGNSANISGKDVDIDANITAGYNKDLTLTITEDMLADLVDDPVTGEKILINLGPTPWANETNNIKALYKDGQIFVYHINNPVERVDTGKRGAVNVNVSSGGNIKTYSGYQNIKIDNQTDKQLNVYNITNNKSDSGYSHSDSSDTTANTVTKANTQIISTGKLVLDGVIENSFAGVNADTAGALSVSANNGLIIKQQTDEDDNVIASILSAGIIDLKTSSGNTDVLGNIVNTGNVAIANTGAGSLNIDGKIEEKEGSVTVSNSNAGALNIAGIVMNTKGLTTVTNTSVDGIKIATTGKIHNSDGNIEISNTGAKGITVEGKILADKQDIVIDNRDSDLTIGELVSNNDDYIETAGGNITINQENGNVLNGVVDTSGAKHQNADFGNQEQSYKTLLSTNGDLIINAIDGNIGYTDNARPGFTIDASTRDWTDSINVNVSGVVNAQAINNNKTDNRLVNLRAKDSDLNVQNITSSGNVILTAADWKQADVRPTPDDEAYFAGYSVLNAADNNDVNISGQNISVIASNNIGKKGKKLTYLQDTTTDPQSSVSFEAENDLYVDGKANSGNEAKIYQMISKHGTIDLDLASDASINEISAGKKLSVTQKAQNLTIMNLGMPADGTNSFADMLNPHDDLVYGFAPTAPEKSVVPQYVNIAVLDAVDTPERSDANLKIYSATVRGGQAEGAQSDITLMADNIYVNSAKAPDSYVSTKNNPNGYKQKESTYTDETSNGSGMVYEAKGINTFGEGKALTVNVTGVDSDAVTKLVDNPQRNDYERQYPVENIPARFKNTENSINDYGFRAKNAVISVNDYTDTERGVEFNKLYADNAYINTMDTNLTIHDSYINNYAEIRNGNRDAGSNRYLAIVDNDYRRLVPSDIQLYTQKTGSFALSMDEKIKFHTMAPVVHYSDDKLVNTFSDENSFVRMGLKETELRQKAKSYYSYYNIYVMPKNQITKYDVWRDYDLFSNVKIMEISHDEALIINRENWKLGEERYLELMFDDVKAKIRCIVTNVDKSYAIVKLLDMPPSVYNKLTYRYMKMAEK